MGLFGGSFDPVHTGHLHVARTAAQAFDLDRVVFVPAAQPPHKRGRVLAPGEHRLAMVRLAIAGEPRFEASDLELGRPGPSYTYDTLRELPGALGLEGAELFLILGSDNLPDLPRWHRGPELLRLAQPVVLLRDEDDPERLLEGLAREVEGELLERLRRGLLRVPPVPGRASDLRERIGRGLPPGPSLPPEVAAYIREHGLYRGDAAP